MSYNRPVTISCETNTDVSCAVEVAMAILAGKWKFKIYKALHFKGALRFSEIRESISQISDKTLTAQLREMEQDGLLTRMVYPEVPPKVEYRLTQLGVSIQTVFQALEGWGNKFMENRDKLPEENKIKTVA